MLKYQLVCLRTFLTTLEEGNVFNVFLTFLKKRTDILIILQVIPLGFNHKNIDCSGID